MLKHFKQATNVGRGNDCWLQLIINLFISTKSEQSKRKNNHMCTFRENYVVFNSKDSGAQPVHNKQQTDWEPSGNWCCKRSSYHWRRTGTGDSSSTTLLNLCGDFAWIKNIMVFFIYEISEGASHLPVSPVVQVTL